VLDIRKSTTHRVSLIGHRGALGHAPENTMASFQKGFDLGANILELDIHLSRDGHVVVIHDFTVDRTTNGTGFVKDMTLADLRRLDAGSRFSPQFAGVRIPTLAEVLEWAKGRVWLAIEIKSDWLTYPGIESKLIDLLRQYDMIEESFAISFDHCCLQRVKAVEPTVATGALYSNRLVDPVGLARTTAVDVLRPRWTYATAEEARIVHDAGLAYAPFSDTRVTPATLRELAKMDADALSSDYPDQLKAVLDQDGA
jgi:glycerophosphoryl diester phosphodiesterase